MAACDCELPLMISAKYLPEWSVWEGVRELVQNWHDGVLKAFERDHSFKESRLLFEKVRCMGGGGGGGGGGSSS